MNLFIILIILIIFILFYFFFIKNPIQNNIDSNPNGKYQVKEFRNALTSEECDQIIELSKKNGLFESKIVTDDTVHGYDTNTRKSQQAWITRTSHPALEKLSKLSSSLTGLPQSNQEMVQVVKYEKGGKFEAHFDACVKGEKICKEMNRDSGQRKTTLLVYLNNVEKGGETEFVNLGIKVKPEKGKAILFWSTDENENVLQESKHRGNELIEGEKWIATIWSHPKIWI